MCIFNVEPEIRENIFFPSPQLILDRIYKAIMDEVKKGMPLQQEIYKFSLNYKKKWCQQGFLTPILDNVVFSKIKAILGGNLRGVATGGASLLPDMQEFIKMNMMCCRVLQGYGLTETSARAVLQDCEFCSKLNNRTFD
jgi:long-chain acyl-CoA synthetase